MKLTVLVDNNTYTDQYFLGEPALCYYIEDEDTRLLFDMGYSNAYLQNAKSINIDVTNVQKIIFSHGHNDHTGGLYFWDAPNSQNIEIVAHPDVFNMRRYSGDEVGSRVSLREISERFTVTLSKTPVNISKNLVFLGQIPQYNTFEYRKQIGRMQQGLAWQPDYLLDDSALVYKSSLGLYIITGCSHSGICNICEHAKAVCGDDRIVGIIGGLHLLECDLQLEQTIVYLLQQNISQFYPCHCVTFEAKCRMHHRRLPVKEVGVGLRLQWL